MNAFVKPFLKTNCYHSVAPSHRKYIMGTSLCLLVAYLSLAIYLIGFGAFWSPDCAARFAMVRSWVEHGQLIHPYYLQSSLDPSGQIHPLAFFLFHGLHSYSAMYEPLFPFLCGVLYRIFGFSGLLIIPVLSGLGATSAIYITARQSGLLSSRFLPLTTGLATPLLIYSVVFWDHAIMIFLAAIAGYLLLRGLQHGRASFALAAGAVLGLGVWFHELMAALYGAIWLSSLPLIARRPQRRLVLGLTLGFIPLALLWAAANYWIYGTVGGPHLSANMGANQGDHPYGLNRILDGMKLAERSLEQLAGTMIVDSRDDLYPYFIAFACLLIGYAIMAWSGGWMRGLAPIVSIAGAGLAVYLVLQVHWANGLFQATPLLIPALAVPWIASRSGARETIVEGRTLRGKVRTRLRKDVPPEDLFWAWLSRAAWLYVLFVLINPMLPGADWGSRYLLPVLPFLVLMAAHALERQYQDAGPLGRHLVGASAVVLVAASFYCQTEGLTMVTRNIRYNQEVSQRARAVTSPVIVMDNIGLGAELTAAFLPQAQFLVRTDEDRALFASVLRRLKATEFTYIGTDMEAQGFSSLYLSRNQYFAMVDTHPFIVDRSNEDGDNLQFARFVLQTGPAVPKPKS